MNFLLHRWSAFSILQYPSVIMIWFPTVAVSELHLHWTRRNVPARQIHFGFWTCSHNRQERKSLDDGYLDRGSIVADCRFRSLKSISSPSDSVVRAFVCLTLIETSFFDPVEETLVYLRRKKIILPVGTIFPKREMPLLFEQARTQAPLSTCLNGF